MYKGYKIHLKKRLMTQLILKPYDVPNILRTLVLLKYQLTDQDPLPFHPNFIL